MSQQTLEGKVTLITGGSRGIGFGVAKAFRAAGADVVISARKAAGLADARAELLRGAGSGEVLDVVANAGEPDQAEHCVEETMSRFGRLDVLVNNAGGAPYAEAATASPRFHDKVIALNLLAPLTVARAANAVMQGQDSGGVIVNVSSVSATRPSPGTASYGAAKAGLDNLTATLAVEWAPKVRVNALDVGMVRTENTSHYGGEEGLAAVGATVPLGRLAEPEEIGACAVFLASPLASYVSGARLAVHGGGEKPAFLNAAGRERA